MVTSKKYLKIFAMVLVIFALVSYAGWKYFQSNESYEEDISSLEKGIKTNTYFPNIDLVDSSGNPLQSKKIREGKVLLVYLMNGCDACDEEVSIISSIQKRAGLDAKVWGVVRESANNANNFHGQKTSIPIIVDTGDRLRKELKIKAFPYNLLLNNGVIVKKWIGVKDEQTFLNHLKDS
jgi:peroxiredoxin